jgi:hypothetical protein
MESDITAVDGGTLDAESDGEHAPNTFLNALIGAVVSVLLGFIPFSPVLGGAVAGYLEGGDSGDGAKVGAISGILAALPLALVIFLGIAFFTIAPEGAAIGAFLLILLIVTVVAAYTALSSVVGGVLGVYIKNEVYPPSERAARTR